MASVFECFLRLKTFSEVDFSPDGNHRGLIELQEGKDTLLGLVSFIIFLLFFRIEEEWIASRP